MSARWVFIVSTRDILKKGLTRGDAKCRTENDGPDRMAGLEKRQDRASGFSPCYVFFSSLAIWSAIFHPAVSIAR